MRAAINSMPSTARRINSFSGTLWVDRYPCCRDPVAEEAQLHAPEGTFRSFYVEPFLPEDAEDDSDVPQVLLQG